MLKILITLDCVRKDLFNLENAPNFYKGQKEWVSFENCYSHSQNTLSSHFTIFTSNYLMQHQVYSNFQPKKLPPYSMDKLLRDKGFETKAVCGISFLSKLLGNQIGQKDKRFDFNENSIFGKIKRKIFTERRKAKEVLKEAINSILKTKNKNFFIWLHLFDAHMPYYSPSNFKNFKMKKSEKKILEQLKEKEWFSPYFEEYEKKLDLEYFPKCYESAIKYIDFEMNEFFDFLKNKNYFDDSLIVLTSDHGECLYGEHNIYCAHKKLFDETINVPLFIKFPGKKFKNEKVSEIVEHIDIAPTVVSFINVEEKKYKGIDLKKFLEGKEKGKEFSFSEHVDNFLRSIRDKEYIFSEIVEGSENKWKMKLEKSDLFKRDGSEVFNREIEERMKKRMKDFIHKIESEKVEETEKLDGEEKIEEQLRSLGYL